MSEENQSNKKIKTLEGWHEAAEKSTDPNQYSWDDYAQPGDLVDEEVFIYFLNILPPRSLERGYLQVGEPHNYRFNPRFGKHRPTFATFMIAGPGVYRYCGNCFVGEKNYVE